MTSYDFFNIDVNIRPIILSDKNLLIHKRPQAYISVMMQF